MVIYRGFKISVIFRSIFFKVSTNQVIAPDVTANQNMSFERGVSEGTSCQSSGLFFDAHDVINLFSFRSRGDYNYKTC